MKRLVKHGLVAASLAAMVVACGGNDKQQQAREPMGSTDTNASTTSTQGTQSWNAQSTQAAPATPSASMQESPSMNPSGPQSSALDTGATDRKDFTSPTASPNDATSTTTTNEGSMQAKQNTSLGDGEIFAIESALNNGEITIAEVARKNARSQQVKDFAAMMITQHRDAQNKAKALAQKAKITAQDDDVSNKLKTEGDGVVADIKTKKGAEFDKAYIDSQVKMHTEGLDIIDNQLLPSVKNGDFKDHLNTVRQHVEAHLSKAQDIQSRLEAAGSTSSTKSGAEPVGTTTTTSGTMDSGKSSTTNKPKTGTTGSGSTGSGGTSGATHHHQSSGTTNPKDDTKDTKDTSGTGGTTK